MYPQISNDTSWIFVHLFELGNGETLIKIKENVFVPIIMRVTTVEGAPKMVKTAENRTVIENPVT